MRLADGVLLSQQSLVSIHAPRVGCDFTSGKISVSYLEFQFTHPVWGATLSSLLETTTIKSFQFTHSVWGATTQTECSGCN